MNIIVQKYGGSSVENKEKLEKICDNITSYKKKKSDLVVVVSAQGKTTDNLINISKSYLKVNPNKRELDLLLSTGEIQTVALLSMMLNERGFDTIGLTGEQAGIISDSTYGNAKIKCIYKDSLLNYLKEGKIVIVAGFQAIDKLGNITTLGRGGSDLSAVAIASVLNAKKCEIYTDVDGVFSADPKVVKNAKLLKKVSYDEMLEASSLGAKVMHNRAVSLGKKYKLPIIVRNSQKNTHGSIIQEIKIEKESENLEENTPKFITKKDNLSKISIIGNMIMSDQNLATRVFELARANDVYIEMISINELSLSIVISSTKVDEFINILHDELINKKSQN
jgi:aspartate kinase